MNCAENAKEQKKIEGHTIQYKETKYKCSYKNLEIYKDEKILKKMYKHNVNMGLSKAFTRCFIQLCKALCYTQTA